MQDEFVEAVVEVLPKLQRYARSLCRCADQADDLVQIAAEKALRARHTYDPSRRLDVWLIRILRNRWIDETRRQKARGTQSDILDNLHIVDATSTSAAEDRLELNDVLAAINALPDAQRDVMMLVCVEDLSYRDASEVLEIPVGTVMSRLSRARKTLAAHLGIDRTDDT